MKKFLVGGAVRDKLMGKTPKDFDYTVVLDKDTDLFVGADGEINLFESMAANLMREGFKIFLKSPEHFTVRAQFPKESGQRLTADFVLARKEGPYSDGRRPDFVLPGTLEDDLARRDFTMNAIAEDVETGEIIDPFNGRQDILDKRIQAVGNSKDRMMEDSLRVLRALRFKIQLGFVLNELLEDTLFDMEVLRALRNVSDERKMDELNKMFRADSLKTLRELNHYHALGDAVFAGRVNLEATMKTKGFNGPKPKKGGSNLPPAYNGCECVCHTEKGVMHMSACCRPSKNS